MGLRFCPSEEVETLDKSKFCGDPGFLRYCCSPQQREFPQEPKEEEEPNEQVKLGKVRCSKNSDCPETQLPKRLDVDTLPDVEVYQCQDSYECNDDYGNCMKEKTCQPEFVPFCTHPKGKNYPECKIKDNDLVYHVNKEGNIECKQDSDCPPPARPSWEWNDETKMEYGVSSITEMFIVVPICSRSVNFGDYGFGDYGSGDYESSDYESGDYGSGDYGSGDYGFGDYGSGNIISICQEEREPFCGHEFGRSHPECQRCNVLTPLPQPECLDFHLKVRRRVFIDRCCTDLFNDTFVEKLKAELLPEEEEDEYFANQIELREDIIQNFTMNDCRLSALHLPQDVSPRTSFEMEKLCCAVGYYPAFLSLSLSLFKGIALPSQLLDRQSPLPQLSPGLDP